MSTATRKLRIGYVMQADAVDMSTPSGPQQHVAAIVRGLEKRGHRVRMVAIQQGETRWTDDLQHWKAARYGLSESAPFRLVESAVRGLQSRVRAPFIRLFDSYRFSDACVAALYGCDLLYERDGTICYGGILAARRLGIPIVLEVNGELIEEWRQLGLPMSPAQRQVMYWITGQIYRRASHIISVGEALKQTLIERWDLEPPHISVVRNGANVELFLERHDEAEVRARFGLNAGRVVVFTGSFQPWHGVDLILEGFGLVAAKVPDARMVFAGDGSRLASLRERASALGLLSRVTFTGRLSQADVARLLSAADVAVIYHRGIAADIVETPLKLFEYMAAEKAIVAPAVPNMKRILVDRSTALLAPPDSPEALASALGELLENADLRRSLGANARREAIEKHSWDRAVREVETVLCGLVEARGRRLASGARRSAGAAIEAIEPRGEPRLP